jgi:uncharacterized protein YtpQ (UPF0354 family)
VGILDFFSSTPSPEKFAKLMVKAMIDSGFSAPIRIDNEQFRLVVGEEGTQIYNLNNVYRDYCRVDKRERKAVLAGYLKAMQQPAELPKTFAEAKDKLLPILRSRAMIEYLLLSSIQDGHKDLAPALKPFSADAVIMLAYDTEDAIMTLTGASLTDWNVTFDDALAVAMDNLRDLTISNFDEILPGLFLGNWDDAYDTSRILFADLVYQLNVGGEPVVMMPTRSRFIVVSGNDKNMLMTMLELSRKFAEEEGRPLSSLMYRFENGRAVEFIPTDSDVREKLASLRRGSLAEDYAAQKDLLDRANEKTGVDVFVASYRILESSATGRQASFAVWTEDVDILLPEADLVTLVSTADLEGHDSERSQVFVAWKDLQAATGAFEKVEERYPPRYKPRNFPDKAARDALPATEP